MEVNPPSTFTLGKTQSTITAHGASGGTYAWSIVSGQGIVSFASSTPQNSTTTSTNAVTVYTIGFSKKANDVIIQLVWTKPNGQQVTKTKKLSVDSPYKLTLVGVNGPNGAANCNKPPGLGNAGWWTQYTWQAISFFNVPMAGISFNENFDNQVDNQANNWPFVPNGVDGNAGVSQFTDTYCAFNLTGYLNPAPTVPQHPLGQNKIDSTTQFYNVGSNTVGSGVTVQTQTLTRYLDHPTVTNIVSPVRSSQ